MLIENNLPAEITKVTDRVPRYQAIRKTLESHVLFHGGWRGFRGMASGKIYEYLGAGRNILIAPNDYDVIEQIIKDTGTGKFADTPAEFAKVLNDWFEEWKTTGKLAFAGKPEKIKNYTREKQAENLARTILSLE